MKEKERKKERKEREKERERKEGRKERKEKVEKRKGSHFGIWASLCLQSDFAQFLLQLFFFCLCPQHAEALGPGMEPVPQQQ